MLEISDILYIIIISIAWIMTIYTLNFNYLSYRCLRRDKSKRENTQSFNFFTPLVTIQLPIYNEKYVAERLIQSVCAIEFPKNKLELQILDDSDDETSEIVSMVVKMYKEEGYNIKIIRRSSRTGYKAGALKEGMKYAKGEFIAIFDADFIPPPDFLNKALPYFKDPAIGLVQCRWGHVNEAFSALTGAQAVSLDLHFLIEQKAKSMTHLFMNFNGTAGIWRTSCIMDAGGWHTSTLVEDLDLSYRAQMKGWKCIFDEDLVVDAELPVQMNAAKRQQFRWAKGSIQVAAKLLKELFVHNTIPIETKIQAFIQLTKHIVNPLFLIQFLLFPLLLLNGQELQSVSWAPLSGIVIYLLLGPATYLFMIRKIWGTKWRDKAIQYLFLIFFATGISVNNSIAVFEAMLGKRSAFMRTPKFGIVEKNENWHTKKYVLPFTKTTLLEIFFGIYGIISIVITIYSGNFLFIPIITIQLIGFFYVAYLSIFQSFRRNSAGLSDSKQVKVKVITNN
jgi:cellulose synthase/poly-beta-1,6-N-acetylglucosamine synthase-like glycosyltransferase